MDYKKELIKRDKPSHTVPSLSGTFGIPARLALSPKMSKEPSIPSRSNALTANLDKTKNDDKLIRKCLIMNKAQCLTPKRIKTE